MSFTDVEEELSSGFKVLLPSGATQPVMNLAEQRYVEDRVALHAEHNKLTNVIDLQELDRLVVLELLTYRIGVWLGKGSDYNGETINEKQLGEQLDSRSTEIRLVKKNLGLDRPARERAKGEGSIAHYWANLQERAKAFGVMRVDQLGKAIELANELIGVVQRYDNAFDDEEREKLQVTQEDILSYIRDRFTPEFQAIDAHFRATEQTFWIRTQ